jgi:GAF domain-containing protein
MPLDPSDTSFLTGDLTRDERCVGVLLGSIGKLLGVTSLEAAFEQGLAQALELTGAERGIILMGNSKGEIKLRASRVSNGVPLLLTTTGFHEQAERAWSLAAPVLTVSVEIDEDPGIPAEVHGMQLCSLMAAPLLAEGRVLGALCVDSARRKREFDQPDLAALSTLSKVLALAIEKVHKPGGSDPVTSSGPQGD